MSFEEAGWVEKFDGIWASASLLHVPRSLLPKTLTRLIRALRPGGVFFMSFKYGTEDRTRSGRLFTDMTEVLMEELIASAGLIKLAIWTSDDVRPGRSHERWVSAICQRIKPASSG